MPEPKKSLRTPLILILATVVFGLVGVGLYQLAGTPKNLTVAEAADGLPGFSLVDKSPLPPTVNMTDGAGSDVTLDAFRGKVVLLNLWATWCLPCIREMPALNALQVDYANLDLVVLPVASGKQGQQTAEEFLTSRNLTALTTYYDKKSTFLDTFGLKTLPSTFLIDRTGKLRGGVLGMAEWNSGEARALIDALINERG